MLPVLYIESITQATALLKPRRIELLKRLDEPRTCPELAAEFGESAQNIYYHIKALEQAGLVEKVGERRVRGTVEGRYQARARSYWLAPQLVGQIGGARIAQDQTSLRYLLSLADVLYGVDNTFLSRALAEDIFEVYESPLLADIPDEFELDAEHRALPVDFGDVCLNYDKAYFETAGIAPPADLEDLTEPAYASLAVVENPATSSPGLAFLLATVGRFGDPGYLDYWADLRANDVLVVNDWETAYYTEFSGSSGKGPRPIVVSYASSPPAEVIFAETPLDEAPTASVVGAGSCFRQIEFAGILQGTANRDLAEAWIDFMLGTSFQADMPLQMFVFPVNPNAQLNETFEKHAAVGQEPAFVSPEDIAANRETWIEAWTEVVLR